MNDPKILRGHLTRSVQIVGVACGHGAGDRRCASGPDALHASDTLGQLQARGCEAAWTDMLRANPVYLSNLEVVAEVCERLAARVAAIVRAGGLPLVLGGDHSCAVGTWKGAASALGSRGPLGLIWIDAHMDAHTPQSSPTGALHGMPLAALLGYGDVRLTGVAANANLDPLRVCVVGVRSFEPEEARLLARLGVRVFYMHEIERRGLPAVIDDALAHVQGGGGSFGVTIDLDALDPNDAPGVGSPVPGGISRSALLAALTRLCHHPQLAAVEIAEYNPARDIEAKTAHLVSDALGALLTRYPVEPASAAVESRYGSHHYEPLPVVLVRGDGVYLWDENGRRYIDMMSAYSAVSHGHSHPRLTRVLSDQARTLAVTSRAFHNDRLPLLLKRLCEITGLDLALPASTGLEAVEAALKTARKWGYEIKGIAQDRAEIICCTDNFHGRSIAIVAMSSEPQYRRNFGPFPPGFKRIAFADPGALESAITPHTAAFLVEPIQGEGGIIVPPAGYLAACAEICRRHNVLLICDEIQTGLGRTGRMLAVEHEAIKPDGVILGKALGGGLLPVSAFVARREVLAVLKPGDHGSTFGGNPLAAAVALEALNILIDERLPQRAAQSGAYLQAQLRAIRSPLIRDVRGRGLLIGVEIDSQRVSARDAAACMLRHGVITKDTHETVLRFAPPLIIERDQIDAAMAGIRAGFAELDTIALHAA